MTKPFRSLLCAGVAIATLYALPARAAGPDVTPEQGVAAETAIRDWLGTILGSNIKTPEHPVQMTPEGDHFAMRVLIWQRDSAQGGDIALTGKAFPMDGGKWHVEDLRGTDPLTYTLDLPKPADAGALGPTVTRPVTFVTEVTGQANTIDFDPSFATPSTMTGSLKSLSGGARGEGFSQDTATGAMNSVTTITPATPGRVDVATNGTLSDYRLDSNSAGTPPFHIEIGTIKVAAALAGMSRDKATSLMQLLVGMSTVAINGAAINGAAINGAPSGGKSPPVIPSKITAEMIPALLTTLQDMASGMDIKESFEDIAVKVGNAAGALEKFDLGIAAKSVDGILQASIDLGMEGLATPNLPLGGMEALIPEKVTLRPFVGGMAVADLLRIARAANAKQDPSPQDIQALFSHGGIVSGVENLVLEIGGATFTGNAKMLATRPDAIGLSGTGQIVAEDFDDLVAKVQAAPMLAQGLPVLILAKGIGRKVGDTLVWDLSYENGKMLVNNLDLSAMAGGGGAGAANPGGAPKRPAPGRQPR